MLTSEQARCGAARFEYTLFNVGISLNLGISVITLLPSCVCAQGAAFDNADLSETKVVAAQDSSGDSCVAEAFSLISLGVIYPVYNVQRTQYDVATVDQVSISGCYSSVTLNGVVVPTTIITNPDTCFTTCRDWRYMTLTPVGTTGTYSCGCGTVITLGSSITCTNSILVVYSNSLAASGNLVARRRRAAAIAARTAKNCPASYSECLVNTPTTSTVASLECIDTQSELESCGGCVNGDYTSDLTASSNITWSGVDCTAIPGVSVGSVSCVRGQCVVSRCRRGYRLGDGTCITDATLKIQDATSYFKRLL